MSSEFQSRLLYLQKSSAIINEQEPVTVSSTIYAIRFMYPGAAQHTTGRLRITCTYRDSDQFEAHAGVIERWSDKGWLLLDDYTDDVYAFHSEEDFRKRMLDYAHAFIMGIPLISLDKGYVPSPSPPTPRKSKPKRLFDFEQKKKTKNEKTKTEDNYDTDSSKNNDDNNDDDDLDWL